MTWIKTIPFDQAEGRLRKLYEQVLGSDGRVDNILEAHSLRPHTLQGHLVLYKNVLHHGGNSLDKRLLEMLGVWVSILNGCAYCIDHHLAGLARLFGDDEQAQQIKAALRQGDYTLFEPNEVAALRYAAVLTRTPGEVGEELIEEMRQAGFDDGEILEINQVISYFAYANRTVLGLGVTTEGDTLGLSPRNSEDPDDWSHR